MFPDLVSQILLIAFAGLLVWAAVSDARRLAIPNRIPMAVAGLWGAYAAARLAAGVPASEILFAAGVGLAALGIGMLMFALRWLGGGDVKLLASVMLWAGPETALPFLIVTTLAGGVLGLAALAGRLVRNLVTASPDGGSAPGMASAVSEALKGSLPFGVAIAAGGMFVAYRLMFGL